VTGDLPALGQLIEGLDLPVPELVGDPSLEKTRLFESVLRLLDRCARAAPLVVLLDDLQWFDRSSLELLAYLAKDLSDLPVLLAGTYRSDDLEATVLLASLIQSLRRGQLTEEIELTALSDVEIDEVVESFFGGPVPTSAAMWVSQQSAGIPLFAEALAADLRDRGTLHQEGERWVQVGPLEGSAPPVVRDVIRERLGRLDEADRRLIDLVSVSAGEAPYALLREVAGLQEPDAGLTRLTSGGFLVERVGDEVVYAVAHPLTALIAYDDLAGPRRRELHARFAEAWEQRKPEDLDQLAYHYRGALPGVDPIRAMEVSVSAGERALDRYANAEALDHLEAALRLVPAEHSDLADRVLVSLGEARFRTGDALGAVDAWDRVAARARPVSIQLQVRAARALSEIDYEACDRRVEEGLALLADAAPSEELVELLFLGVVIAHRVANPGLAEWRAGMIAQAAELVGTGHARALRAAAEVTLLLDRGDFRVALNTLETHTGIFPAGGPLIELRAHTSAGVIAAAWGDLPALRAANRRAGEVVRRIGVPSGEIRHQLSSFLEAFYGGDWERAWEVAVETRLLADALDHHPSLFLAQLFEVLLFTFRGEFHEAEQRLIEAKAGMAPHREVHGPIFEISKSVELMIALERGEITEILADLGPRRFVPGPLPPWGLAVRGEVEARGGQPAEALKTANLFKNFGPTGSYPDVMAARLYGLALDAIGDVDEAIRHLAYAYEGFSTLALPFEAARAGIEMAEVAVRAQRPERMSADRVAECYRAVTRLGAKRYVGRARRLLQSLGATLPADSWEEDITPRQLEVAGLVAEGLSNAEIGEQLFISVRTVHSHLDHIYTRLGLSSRAGLASWVTERRLRGPT
jgi:DNA-binding NarL/FixJ family response regulator